VNINYIPLECEGGEEAVDESDEGDAFPCNACRRCKRRRLIWSTYVNTNACIQLICMHTTNLHAYNNTPKHKIQ